MAVRARKAGTGAASVTISAGTPDLDQLLLDVAERLREDPSAVAPVLRLVADPEGLADDAADTGFSAARRTSARRSAERLQQFKSQAFTTAEVRSILGGITRQAVSIRVTSGHLLAHEIAGRNYFPDWQFGAHGPVDGLPRITAALRLADRDAIAADTLMRAPLPEEGNRSPADLLAAGDVDAALHYVRSARGGV